MAAKLSEGVILKTLKNLIKKATSMLLIPLLVIGGLPLGINNVYAAEGDDTSPAVIPEGAPAHGKKLVDNGDGTYTLSLSVTGKASSSTTQEVTKSNVILLIDTSSSMNSSANGYNGTRLEAERDALTKTDGIIDKLLANNTTEISDIIELYGINFGTGATKAWDWSTDGDAIKTAINDLGTNTGTNWEEALIMAKEAADAKHAVEPDENTYVIFMTDGQPTTHQNDYTVNTTYRQEWAYANDDARAIVSAGYTFYGIFTFGSGTSSNYLKSLVNYAYTGSGTYNSALSSDYAQYFYDATDTQALIDALEAIVDEITSNVGYTNIAMSDGLTDLTSSMKVDGKISNLTYTRSGGSYGAGTVWTDAPKATTTNGTVNWNLGSRVLEDGVTYTVSFVVWPSQESYDLVADLNNGKRTYESLSAAQQASIINTDGVYTLKTNTDYPKLTYSTITTTTSNAGTETVISKPTTINIKNPDPVGLKNEKLTLEKKWEDSLDPSQREEVNGEVTLNFYKDGQPYEEEIILTELGGWKLKDYISIAPGILLSNESTNYDLLKQGHKEYSFNGKKYIILETGHDYYFEEKDINNHFELTNYIYHPMLVDNQMKNVFFTYDDDGNITGIEEFRDMDSVSATNTLKGGINIEKKVVDQNNNSIDTKDSFKITAHLVGTDGKPYKYDYRIYYGEKNPEYESHIVYNDDGSVRYSRTGHIYGTGDLTETIYVGDVIRIVNVDAGVEYYVEEEAKAGYDKNPVISYEEKYGDSSTSSSSVETSDGYYVVSGNTASTVTVTNKFLNEKTRVDFEKTWYGTDGKVLSGKDLPGSITVELFKKGADGKVVSTGKTEKATSDTNWKASFKNLTKYDNGVEITYSIKESAIEGATYNDQQDAFFEYDTEENNGKHAVVGKWKVATLEDYILQNTWTPATESVTGRTSFNIKKVDKSTGEPLEGVTFELTLKDGATVKATTNGKGEATFDDLGSGEYTLKESDALDGYKLITTEPNINITSIKKLNTVDLVNVKNFYEYVYSFSTSQVNGYTFDAQSRTFTVENEPIPYDDITAKKVWDDDGDRDGLRKNYTNYYVAVRNNSGKFVAYEKLVLVDKDNYVFSHLPVKTASNEDITYEIVEASACSGKGDAIKCTEFKGDDDYTVTITDGVITNKHKPALYDETGDLTVEKSWTGEGNTLVREAVKVVLYGQITDDEGVTTTWKEAGPEELSAVTEWKYTFHGLYKNKDGKEITYVVEETAIGKNTFGSDSNTLVIYDGDKIKGSWTKSEASDHTVTNEWKEAKDKVVYEGAKKFEIKKVDENYKAMAGVVFDVNGNEKTTGEDGTVSKSVPVTADKKEESFKFEISEKETLDGYDLAKGSATIAVTCTSELSGVDTDTLVNTYTKTCAFNADVDEAFAWDVDSLTLTVMNKRSLAKSFTIKKTVVGADAEDLTDLEFVVNGPEDFEEVTLKVGEDCTIDGDEITCELKVKIPTGKYTVEEKNAEIEGFELISVTSDEEIEVKKNQDAVFEITNEYEEIVEPPVDPCADGEGCGGIIEPPVTPPATPETGVFTTERGGASDGAMASAWVMMAMGVVTVLTMAGAVVIARKRK